VEALLRRKLLLKMQKIPIESLDRTQRGDWLTRMSGDLRNTESFITIALPGQVRNVVILSVVFVMFARHTGSIAWGLLASSAFLPFLNIKIQKYLTPYFEKLRSMHGDIFQALLENYEGVRTIRSLNIGRHVAAAFDRKVNAVIEKGLQVVRAV